MDDDVVAFLQQQRDVALFCRDSAANPLGYPMRTVACNSSELTFTTYRKSAKVRHVERDPRVCVLASVESRSDVRWVSLVGRARVVAPSEEELESLFGASASDGRVPTGMGEFVKQRLREGKRILICVDELRTAGLREGTFK